MSPSDNTRQKQHQQPTGPPGSLQQHDDDNPAKQTPIEKQKKVKGPSTEDLKVTVDKLQENLANMEVRISEELDRKLSATTQGMHIAVQSMLDEFAKKMFDTMDSNIKVASSTKDNASEANPSIVEVVSHTSAHSDVDSLASLEVSPKNRKSNKKSKNTKQNKKQVESSSLSSSSEEEDVISTPSKVKKQKKVKVKLEYEDVSDSEVSMDEFIEEPTPKKNAKRKNVKAPIFRLKQWEVKDVSDFIQQFKGSNITNINIRGLLFADVEAILRSRRVDLNSSRAILRECKKFVAMEEKEREEGVIDRIKNLKWPTPRRDQTGKENIRGFLHALDKCLSYRHLDEYMVGAKKLSKLILEKVPDYLAISPILAHKVEYQSMKGLRALLVSQASYEHKHWQVMWANEDRPKKAAAKQVEVDEQFREATKKDDAPQLYKFEEVIAMLGEVMNGGFQQQAQHQQHN